MPRLEKMLETQQRWRLVIVFHLYVNVGVLSCTGLKNANGEPAHPEKLAGRLYIPTQYCQEAFAWGHSPPLSRYPGQYRTIQLLQRAFWWPCV